MLSVYLDIRAETASEQSAAGRIRLGVSKGLGSSMIAPALKCFRESHPKIDIDLIALSGFVSVPKRQADMSILLTRPSSGLLKVRKCTDYSLQLYVARDYLEDSASIDSRADLQNHTLIGYVDDRIYSSLLRYIDELLPGLTPHLYSPSIVAQLEMVTAGTGLGILPTFMADRVPQLIPLLKSDISVTRSF